MKQTVAIGRRRARDPIATREALITAAERIFYRAGYFSTHSNAIAQAAGLSPASFYRYFPDKLSIFLAVYERWVRAELDDVAQVQLTSDGRTAIREILRATFARHLDTVVFRRSLAALMALEPRVRDVRSAQRARQLDGMLEIVTSLGARPPSLETRLVVLLAIERVADAVAGEDTRGLGADPDVVLDTLADLVEASLFEAP
jgi:AcrR family transcriptional regulator